MKKLLGILVLNLLFCGGVNAGCDDTPTDGVDYSNCQFSEGQDLSRSYIPNSNLSFISFIKVIFDKSIMMNSILTNGIFPESSFVRANLYEANLEGGNFEKTNFTSANLTRVNFKGASLIEAIFSAMIGTKLGLFLFPLCGCGVKYGESVSIIIESKGTYLTTSSSSFANVTKPVKEILIP